MQFTADSHQCRLGTQVESSSESCLCTESGWAWAADPGRCIIITSRPGPLALAGGRRRAGALATGPARWRPGPRAQHKRRHGDLSPGQPELTGATVTQAAGFGPGRVFGFPGRRARPGPALRRRPGRGAGWPHCGH